MVSAEDLWWIGMVIQQEMILLPMAKNYTRHLRFFDSDNQFAQKEQIPVEVVYAYIEAKIDA